MTCPWCGREYEKKTTQQIRTFYALAEAYQRVNRHTHTMQEAKTELKHLFGVWVPTMDIAKALIVPPYEGEHHIYDGTSYFYKTLADYDKSAEMSPLIDCTIQACIECEADIEAIMAGMKQWK